MNSVKLIYTFCTGASEDSFTMSTTPKAGSKASTSEVRASSRNPSTIGRGAAAVSSAPFFCFQVNLLMFLFSSSLLVYLPEMSPSSVVFCFLNSTISLCISIVHFVQNSQSHGSNFLRINHFTLMFLTQFPLGQRQSGPKNAKTSAALAAEAYETQMQGQALFNLKDSHKVLTQFFY